MQWLIVWILCTTNNENRKLSGQLVVVGGSDGTHSLCTTEVLDVRENVWKAGPTMTTCRANVAVAVVDDRLWAVGGFSGNLTNLHFFNKNNP